MTARARYQRIPGLFWSEDSLIVQMQSICFIEEYDACMSALSVALCPLFFLLRGTGQVDPQADRPHSS